MKTVDRLSKASHYYKWACAKAYFFKTSFTRERDTPVSNNRSVIFLKCSHWSLPFICIHDRNGGLPEKTWIHEWRVGGNHFAGYRLDEDSHDAGWYWRLWAMEMRFDTPTSLSLGQLQSVLLSWAGKCDEDLCSSMPSSLSMGRKPGWKLTRKRASRVKATQDVGSMQIETLFYN